MGEYSAELNVDASVERAFEVFVDASRYPQWQAAALRAFGQTGPLSAVGSSVRIDHGPGMKRTMTIVEADPPRRLLFRQQGMGLDDTTELTFEPGGDRTRIRMRSELRVAGGAIGRLLERLGRGQTRAEYQRELDRFAAVVTRRPEAVDPPGSIVTADSAAGFRVLKILAVDPDVVHVALLPGVAKQRPTDPEPYLDAESRLTDPLGLRPLEMSVRNFASKVVTGQPCLRLDGGVGVPHVALTLDSYGDARPEPLGAALDIWENERLEIESWRRADGPILGRELDAEITPLLTVKTDEGYGMAKLLHVDGNAVHLRVYSDRWDIPPDDVDPWSLRLGKVGEPVIGIGHLPLSRRAFASWEPAFDRLVMMGRGELGGYRTWLGSGGGVFD